MAERAYFPVDVVCAWRWPNLFVVGGVKCGTSSLHAYLDQHPDIYMSRVKEPHYFSPGYRSDAFANLISPAVTDTQEYLALFDHTSAPVRGESSTSYLRDPSSAPAIKTVSPDAKIVAILRDPIERAYSHFCNGIRYGREGRTFLAAIQEELAGIPQDGDPYIGAGFYSAALEQYFDLFGENVYVMFFENMISDFVHEMREVFRFLGVDSDYADRLVPEKKNEFALPRNKASRQLLLSGGARAFARRIVPFSYRSSIEDLLLKRSTKPPMQLEARQLLTEAYRPDRQRLEKLLGIRMPWPELTAS